MLERGKVFYEKLVAARGKVAKVAAHFITDGSVRTGINYLRYMRYFHYFLTFTVLFYQTILTHSKSRVVLQAMKEAAANNKIFEVYVTSTSPDNNGYVKFLNNKIHIFCVIPMIINFNLCSYLFLFPFFNFIFFLQTEKRCARV